MIAPFPKEVVLTLETLRWPFMAKEVPYWKKFDVKVTQLLRIEGNLLCT